MHVDTPKTVVFTVVCTNIYFNTYFIVMFMVDFYFYKGRYRVKVLTKSAGYWIVEAKEDFEDQLNGKKVEVRAGEQRIVPLSELYKKQQVFSDTKVSV